MDLLRMVGKAKSQTVTSLSLLTGPGNSVYSDLPCIFLSLCIAILCLQNKTFLLLVVFECCFDLSVDTVWHSGGMLVSGYKVFWITTCGLVGGYQCFRKM